ncbi:MAG: hypothetical protein EBT63_06155 [Proteobacteria bacterium]|nr:hypothetical protein [Pseudomonadota bacterium]NCA28765.1 hypothetical protein [Pseudomonadota bacterium]
MFLALANIGTIAFSPSALMASHPVIAFELAGHSLGHILHGFLKRNRKKRGLSRSQMRKMANRRRRQFVDNIIMHHQRLANINRQVVVSNARERALARREKMKKQIDMRNFDSRSNSQSFEKEQDIKKRWRGGISLKERGQKIRGMTDARRTRARSRWLTIVADKKSAIS